ncbi:hypothetical protein ACLB2K_052563 [Fragaria x ananassa]
MALSPSKGIVLTIPVLVLSASLAVVVFFFLMSSLSSCTYGGGRVPVAEVPSALERGGDGTGVGERWRYGRRRRMCNVVAVTLDGFGLSGELKLNTLTSPVGSRRGWEQ